MANGLSWHGRFANNSVYRLVRIGSVAVRLDTESQRSWDPSGGSNFRTSFNHTRQRHVNVPKAFPVPSALSTTLTDFAHDLVVVGFKSVVCYRTGLDVRVNSGDLSDV